MRRLLSEPIVLRSTRMLGNYLDDAPLAHRLGDLRQARFKCQRITDTRFHVADHPFEVTEVWAGDELTKSYEAHLEHDDAGNTWTELLFSVPVPLDDDVTAAGIGKRDPVTGEVIENPADLMAYVAALGGHDLIFPELRAQAAAEGLRGAGSIDQAGRSTQSWLDEIASSFGAIWTPSTSRLYPNPALLGSVIELSAEEAVDFEPPLAQLEDTADILRVTYNRADATGKFQNFIELTASPQLYGGVPAEVFLPWLRVPANAEVVGRRLLHRMAGRRYEVPFTVARSDIRPCQWVRPVDNPEWLVDVADPAIMVLAVAIEDEAGSTRITGETVISTPAISVSGHSLALSDTSAGGVDVERREGVVTFTVRHPDGRPLPGARVSLDGGPPKITDEQGRVSFAVPATGAVHELLIERPGMQLQRVEITI